MYIFYGFDIYSAFVYDDKYFPVCMLSEVTKKKNSVSLRKLPEETNNLKQVHEKWLWFKEWFRNGCEEFFLLNLTYHTQKINQIKT